MVKGIFSAKATTVSIVRSWKARLLVGAGLLLVAACIIPATPDNDLAADSLKDLTTSVPVYTPSAVDTATPVAKAAAGGGAKTPDSEAVSRRTLPNIGDSTARRIPDTPVPEPARLLPKNTLTLVLAVRGSSSFSTLKTIINDSSTSVMLGTKFIQLESSS